MLHRSELKARGPRYSPGLPAQLLRDYFPKGTDLRVHTPEQIAEVAAELNERPRKTLGWATPAALLADFAGALAGIAVLR